MTTGKPEKINDADSAGIPNFTISGGITTSTFETFMTFYQKAVSDKAKKAVVFINSGGGYSAVGQGISQVMVNSEIKFYTCGTGWCCSAALYILAHGDIRCVTEDCSLMYHKLWSGAFGNPDEVMATGKRLEKEQKVLQRSFSRRTKKNAPWWNRQAKKNPNKEFWFYSKDAKKLGVVDHVGFPEIVTVEKEVKYKIKIKKK